MTKLNTYQSIIQKSRYSRYLPEELRREHWNETTARWIKFFRERFPNPDMEIPWYALEQTILNMDALPSMRSIMTAGEALKRTHVAAYNCAYLPVDSARSFDEAMYILLCGTGVGFSVEEQYVSHLPTVPSLMLMRGDIIQVEDSKRVGAMLTVSFWIISGVVLFLAGMCLAFALLVRLSRRSVEELVAHNLW